MTPADIVDYFSIGEDKMRLTCFNTDSGQVQFYYCRWAELVSAAADELSTGDVRHCWDEGS